MRVFLLVLAALTVACTAIEARAARSHWNAFKAQYSKIYTSSEEERRFGVFTNNLERIEKLNAEHELADFGVNYFSDLTGDEFHHLLGHKQVHEENNTLYPIPGVTVREAPPSFRPEPQRARVTLPTSFASPYTTPVQSQGCGDCWAFASSGALEAAWKKATGNTVRFAPQQTLDCSGSGTCDGGWGEKVLAYYVDRSSMANTGVQLESNYPYKHVVGTCAVDNSKAVGFMQRSWNFALDESIGGLTDTMLYNNGPMVVILNADTLGAYSSGILTHTAACSGTLNHEVLLTGWGTQNGVNYWVIKNSWGTWWGENGYFRIARGSKACGLSSSIGVAARGSNFVAPPACGTRTCGITDAGSGSAIGLISCGWCQGTQACQSNGQCITTIGVSAWSEMFGANHFTVATSGASTTITTSSTVSTQYFLKWTASSDITSKAWNSFKSSVIMNGAGSVGLGITSASGSNNGLFWQIKVPSDTTAQSSFSVCTLDSGSKACQIVATASFPLKTQTTLTAYFHRSGATVSTWLEMNGVSVTGKQYVAVAASRMAGFGELFVVSSGANTFTSIQLSTRTRLTVTGSTYCILTSQSADDISSFLGIAKSVLQVSVASGYNPCATYGSTSTLVHDIILQDAPENLGNGVYSYTYSNTLFNRLVDLYNSGTLAKKSGGYKAVTMVSLAALNSSLAITLSDSMSWRFKAAPSTTDNLIAEDNGVFKAFARGTPSFVAADGDRSGLLLFNTPDQYIVLGDKSIDATSMTAEFWVRMELGATDPLARQTLFSMGTSAASYAAVYVSKSSLMFELVKNGVTTTVASTTGIPVYAWTHVAVTWSSTGSVALFVNGASVATGTAPVGLMTVFGDDEEYASPDFLYFCKAGAGSAQNFRGALDRVALYKRALNATEIAADATSFDTSASSTATYKVNGLTAFFPLGETSGTTTRDATGNGHVATLTSASWKSGGFLAGGRLWVDTDVKTAGTITLMATVTPTASSAQTGWNMESIIDSDIPSQAGTGIGLSNFNIKVMLDNTMWETGVSAPVNTETVLTVTITPTQAVLYKNYVKAASFAYTQGSVTDNTYRIGYSKANALGFTGIIKNVMFFSRALTSSEVTALPATLSCGNPECAIGSSGCNSACKCDTTTGWYTDLTKTLTCKAVCGDGIRAASEECEAEGAGCSGTCKCATGYVTEATGASCLACISPMQPCGTKTCGSFFNGCRTVSCGNCSDTFYCNNQCYSLDTLDQWGQVAPDTMTSRNFAVSGSALTQINFTNPSVMRILSYTGPQTNWYSSSTTASVMATATDGTVAVGLRLWQGTGRELDKIGFKVSPTTAGTATVQYCKTFWGAETCTSMSTSAAFSLTTANNLTVAHVIGSTTAISSFFLNNIAIGAGQSEAVSGWKRTGSVWVAASGSKTKSFTSLTVRTATTCHVALTKCMTTSAWNAFVANLLGLPAASVVSRSLGSDASCSRKRAVGEASFLAFETTIPDNLATSTPSTALFAMLQQSVAGSSVVSSLVEAAPEVAVAGAAGSGLSTGAIAAIAAGGCVAVGAVAAVAIGAVVVAKRTRQQPQEESGSGRRMSFLEMMMPRGGIDVLGTSPTRHHTSISGRSVPIAVDIPAVAQEQQQ